MLVTSKELLLKAKEDGYAVGAFNSNDIPTAEAIISAAEELRTPVIVQIGDFLDQTAPESRRMSFFDCETYLSFLKFRAERASVPVAIHLDHCKTFDGCIRTVQFGATSVMIDGSMLPLEENISLTKKVVNELKGKNVTVEAEIGHVAGHPGDVDNVYTSVEDAVRFYEETKVDILAVSIGTCHGVYLKKPDLNYERISEIKEAIPAPLVMHGASGLSPDQYEECIKRGITKINFATYMMLAGGNGVRETVKAAGDGKLMFGTCLKAGIDAQREIVKEHIRLFRTKPID